MTLSTRLLVAVVFGTMFSASAQAQGTGTANPSQIPVATAGASSTSLAFPTIFGAASAVPAPSGTGYVALTYADPRGGIDGNDSDGDIGAGYTIGNVADGVALSFGVTVTSLENDFGDSGEFYVSASRLLQASSTSMTFAGISAGSLFGWGDADDGEEAYSAYVSHVVGFQTANGEIPVQFTVGYGNETTYNDNLSGELESGLFAGVGIGVAENLSLSASGTETQLNLGATLTVPQVPGLGISAGVFDVTDNVERQQFSLSIALGF